VCSIAKLPSGSNRSIFKKAQSVGERTVRICAYDEEENVGLLLGNLSFNQNTTKEV